MTKHKILQRGPREYPVQGKSHCGVYTAKAVIEALKDTPSRNPEEYHISFLGRATGSVTPQMMLSILKSQGLEAKIGRVKNLSDEQKIETIKNLLTKESPVILLIGNGYKDDQKYSRVKKELVAHWISVWGYNDMVNKFYIYDPAIPQAHHLLNIPIGNITRTYDDIVRDWSGAFFTKPVWLDYLHITVTNND